MTISQTQKTIIWQAINKALVAAVEKAEAMDLKINVAVVDNGGNLTGFLRMPNAILHAIEIAQDKAYTAASFGIATDKLYEIIEASPALKDGIMARPKCVLFAGGLPIMDGENLIGGIGVSGGSEEQDHICAKAGLDAIFAS